MEKAPDGTGLYLFGFNGERTDYFFLTALYHESIFAIGGIIEGVTAAVLHIAHGIFCENSAVVLTHPDVEFFSGGIFNGEHQFPFFFRELHFKRMGGIGVALRENSGRNKKDKRAEKVFHNR